MNECEFYSNLEPMSTVVRAPEGKISLYCKGADSVILERLTMSQLYTEKALFHLQVRRSFLWYSCLLYLIIL